jgi:hypothetical protein
MYHYLTFQHQISRQYKTIRISNVKTPTKHTIQSNAFKLGGKLHFLTINNAYLNNLNIKIT